MDFPLDYFSIFVTVVSSSIFLILFFIYRYLNKAYSYFKVRGVPGPKFLFIADTLSLNKFQGDEDEKWIKEFGPVVGTFEGFTPCLLLTDAENIEILLSNRQNISDKKAASIEDADLKEALKILSGESEGIEFDALKIQDGLEKLFPVIVSKADQLVQNITALRNDESKIILNIDDFVTESIAEIIFGIDLKTNNNLKPDFGKHLGNVLNGRLFKSSLQFLCGSEPNWICSKATALFFKKLTSISLEEEKETANVTEILKKEGSKDEDIVAQTLSTVLVLKGWTKSTILAAVWELTQNPLTQEKLGLEIFSTDDEKINFKTISTLKYLNNLILETVRLHPSEFRIEKILNAPIIFKEDLKVESNCIVSIPLFPLHRNDGSFKDAKKFDPDRFDSKLKPFSYFPTAAGENPTNISHQIGFLVVKIVLFKIIKKFKLSADTNQQLYAKGPQKAPIIDDFTLTITNRD